VVDPKDISSVGASQSVWYVDPIAGLDTNTGVSAGTALQSCNELRRRLRMMTSWAELAAPPFNGNCVDVEGTSVTTAVV